MKNYVEPDFEVKKFGTKDILTVSGEEPSLDPDEGDIV